MENKQQQQTKIKGAYFCLLAFLFAFSVKGQTFTPDVRTPIDSNQKSQHTDKLNVYASNHKIIFSVPQELLGKAELVFDLYDNNNKLISATCMQCCLFIDVCNLAAGDYLYVIKSGNTDLETGKLNLN